MIWSSKHVKKYLSSQFFDLDIENLLCGSALTEFIFFLNSKARAPVFLNRHEASRGEAEVLSSRPGNLSDISAHLKYSKFGSSPVDFVDRRISLA